MTDDRDDLWIPKVLRYNPVMDTIHDTLLGVVIFWIVVIFFVWSFAGLHSTLREIPFFENHIEWIFHHPGAP